MNLSDKALLLGRAGYVALGGFLFAGAFACAPSPAYRVVKKTQFDGVITLYQPNSPEARAEVDRVMRDHCRGDYEVVEEGEVVVGTDQTTHSSQNSTAGRTWFGNPNVHSSGTQQTSQRDATEYRLNYRCKAGGAPPPAGPPGAPPPAGQAPPPRADEIHTLIIRTY